MQHMFGIKMVWAGWTDDRDTVGFSPHYHGMFKNAILSGTRMLIYELETNGENPSLRGRLRIVGEVKVNKDFYRDDLKAPTVQHPWLLGIEFCLRSTDIVHPLTAAQVQTVIGGNLIGQRGESWRQITREDQYMTLRDMLTRGTTCPMPILNG